MSGRPTMRAVRRMFVMSGTSDHKDLPGGVGGLVAVGVTVAADIGATGVWTWARPSLTGSSKAR